MKTSIKGRCIGSAIGVFATLLLLGNVACTPSKPTPKEVHILLFGPNPLLMSVKDGIQLGLTNRLRELGIDDQYVFVVRDAGLQPVEAAALATLSFSKKPAAVIALGTPMIHAALSQKDDITPLLFGATSDPKSLGLTQSGEPAQWRQPGALIGPDNVYGLVSDFAYSGMADLVVAVHARLQSRRPTGKVIGYPLNDTEPNSVLAAQQLEAMLTPKGFKLIRSPASESSETAAASRTLLLRGAAILQVGPDNTVAGGLAGILSTTEGRSVPVLASERESVRRGAVAAVGVDFNTLGRELGALAADVLTKQSKAITNRIQLFSQNRLYINTAAADTILGGPARESLVAEFKSQGYSVEEFERNEP